MRELTGEAEEEATWAASGVNERDHRTTPPRKVNLKYGNFVSDKRDTVPLCDIEQ